MCSIGEDDFGDEGGKHTMPVESKVQFDSIHSDEICKRCNQRNVVVKLNFKDAQCEECFFQYVRHKFRASLGSTRIIERGAKVLLVFDGTVESCVMYDIVRYALSQEKFRRLTIEPIAIYIDETFVTKNVSIEREKHIKEAFRIMKMFDFDIYYTTIASNNLIPIKVENPSIFQLNYQLNENEQMFLTKLKKIGNSTAKEDFLNISRSNIMRWAASQIQCKYIFISTTSQQVATELLINVALGRGKSVASDISFYDQRTNCNARVLRPMRNIIPLEIENYVRLNNEKNQLIKINDYSNKTKMPSISSIHLLTKQFINNLQENFTSTVSTVFRTGDKISAAVSSPIKHDSIEEKQKCKFCHSDLDYENSTTLFAIEYSRCVSSCADQKEVNDVNLMQQHAVNQVLGANNTDDSENLMKYLCHGCRNIFRDLDEQNDFIDRV